MGACSMLDAIEQSAEIEDLLRLLGVQVNVFRVTNPGEAKKLIDTLRRNLNAAREQ